MQVFVLHIIYMKARQDDLKKGWGGGNAKRLDNKEDSNYVRVSVEKNTLCLKIFDME